MKKLKRLQLYIICFLFGAFIFSLGGFILLNFSHLKSAQADEITLNGSGTESHPYLIEDESDYITFVNAVNGGKNFLGKYVTQTADLNFSSYKDITPIGVYGSGKYFRGCYDGGGYSIKNIKISADCGGMFGTLGGTVKNVKIESGTFSGDRVGCIAYSAADSSAVIINCYTAAKVTSSSGAGGITFIFNIGGVYNCVSVSTAGKSYIPINGSYAALSYNCHTKGDSINATSSGTVTDCTVSLSDSDINSKDFALTMNRGAVLSCENYSVMDEHGLKRWLYEGGKTELVSSYDEDFSGYKLEGQGTKEEPYLIASAKDFRFLAYMCNTLGYTFEGEWFKQTEDIDFAYEPMEAVAKVDSGVSFCGNYDGAGHVMQSYRIYEGIEANTAFFGVIGGFVANLGLEQGYIYGGCVAGIAVNSSAGTTVVFNCYSKATLGGIRCGGIVDNFSGNVIGCISSATSDGKAVPLAGYQIRIVADCYSTGEIIGYVYNDKSYNNFVVSEKKLYTAEVEKKMNNSMESSIYSYDFDEFYEMHLWNLSDKDGKLFAGTARSVDDFNPANYFSSSGSSSDPYIIDSVEDFMFFHHSVNAGYRYSGMTVKQTVDLDFDDAFITPIGIFDSDDTFCGMYDGGGYTLNNLNIYQMIGVSNTGLFGSLAGFVYNLGYVSGTIYGALSAGIAYYGSMTGSRIVNCYFTGNIDSGRASGISDTFSGQIINCWCDCYDVQNSSRAPLVAIIASYVYHSFSTGGICERWYGFISMDSGYISTDDIKEYPDMFVSLMNAGCLYAARMNECPLQELTAWTYDGKTFGHGEYFTVGYRDYITNYSGIGTSSDPYKISSAEDMYRLQLVTSSGERYLNQYFVQTCDIDCSSIKGALPIGCLYNYYFYGVYDGRGNSITNLSLYGSVYSSSSAFILRLGGKLMNVCLYKCSVQGEMVGGLVAYADVQSQVKIINCIVSKTVISGSVYGAGILLYGREADVYNCVYLTYGGGNKIACFQANRLFGVYTDGALSSDDYEYVSADDCYIITDLPTVENRVTYSQAIKDLNSNIIKLKTEHGMSIVGQIASFRSDGDGGIVFDGMFSVNFSNLGESLSAFGNEILLYIVIYLCVGAALISAVAEISRNIKKKRKVSSRGESIRRGTVKQESRDEVYDEFYAEREAALSLAEEKLLGSGGSSGEGISRDAPRVSVFKEFGERRSERKNTFKRIGEDINFGTVDSPSDVSEGEKPKIKRSRQKKISRAAQDGDIKNVGDDSAAKGKTADEGVEDVISISDVLNDRNKK